MKMCAKPEAVPLVGKPVLRSTLLATREPLSDG